MENILILFMFYVSIAMLVKYSASYTIPGALLSVVALVNISDTLNNICLAILITIIIVDVSYRIKVKEWIRSGKLKLNSGEE